LYLILGKLIHFSSEASYIFLQGYMEMDISEKTSIQLKMYLKKLAILEKASISLKKSSIIIEIFIKAPNF
jgi:hypothetical protein